MSAMFSLIMLGLVGIAFLKSGGGEFVSGINEQVKNVFVNEKPADQVKFKDRNVEDA